MAKPGLIVTLKTTRTLGKTQVCEQVHEKNKLHLLWTRIRRGIKTSLYYLVSHMCYLPCAELCVNKGYIRG